MKFKDLEIGQTFRWPNNAIVQIKTGSGGYAESGTKGVTYADKRQRDFEIIPESEPPSMIEAAKRDARWYLLRDMEVSADEVRTLRDRESIGIFEAQRRIKQANLLSGLDVLSAELIMGNDPGPVLHDLIEIVRELV